MEIISGGAMNWSLDPQHSDVIIKPIHNSPSFAYTLWVNHEKGVEKLLRYLEHMRAIVKNTYEIWSNM